VLFNRSRPIFIWGFNGHPKRRNRKRKAAGVAGEAGLEGDDGITLRRSKRTRRLL